MIELKVRHKSLEKTVADGLSQIVAYMDRCGADEGHLVIFVRDPGRGWGEKIYQRLETRGDRPIQVWGM